MMIIFLMSIFAGFVLSVQDLIEPVLSKTTQYLSFEEILPLRSSSRVLNSDLQKTFEHRFKEEVYRIHYRYYPVGWSFNIIELTRTGREGILSFVLPGNLPDLVGAFFWEPESFVDVSFPDHCSDSRLPCTGFNPQDPSLKYIKYIVNKIQHNKQQENIKRLEDMKNIKRELRNFGYKIMAHSLCVISVYFIYTQLTGF